jgi:hypothetical protein
MLPGRAGNGEAIMPYLAFLLPDENDNYEALLGTEGVRIEQNIINEIPYQIGKSRAHVRYTLDKETVDQEKYRLTTCIEKARLVDRGAYGELKNAKQREIYLLSKHGIGGREGADVQELMKPEMASILAGGKA